MTARPLVLVTLLLAFSGCLQAGAFNPFSQDYRLVLLEGSYARETRGDQLFGACGFPSTPEVNETLRTIIFHNEAPPASARALVLAVTWDGSGCGSAHTQFASLAKPVGETTLDLPGLGIVRFEFRDDGTTLMDDQVITPGGLTMDASGEGWNATTRARDMGSWPLAGRSLS